VASALTRYYALDDFLSGYVKDIVYKTPVTSLDELKLRIVAPIETVTPQMLENLEGNGIPLGHLTSTDYTALYSRR
jgi:hypothetical protein